MSRPLYKIDRTSVRRFVRENHFATIATQNFLAAFGVYLAEVQGWGRDEILAAFSDIDGIMNRDDNAQRLEEMAQIRLEIKG